MHRVGPADDPVPIGTELAHVTVAVVDGRWPSCRRGGRPDRDRRPRRGPRLLEPPGLTAARFVPDPRPRPLAAGRARLYLTGDLGRRRADGAIVYLGRADAQLKLRGHRIEPGEVEAVLTAHPDVALAAVVAGADGARLDALVVARRPVDADGAGRRAAPRRRRRAAALHGPGRDRAGARSCR